MFSHKSNKWSQFKNITRSHCFSAFISNIKFLPLTSVEIHTFHSAVNIKWIWEQDRWAILVKNIHIIVHRYMKYRSQGPSFSTAHNNLQNYDFDSVKPNIKENKIIEYYPSNAITSDTATINHSFSTAKLTNKNHSMFCKFVQEVKRQTVDSLNHSNPNSKDTFKVF